MSYSLPEAEGQPTVEEVKAYLRNAIESFKSDPADSDFQRGFLDAMVATYADLFLTQEKRRRVANHEISLFD